jgi:hypothetical protein
LGIVDGSTGTRDRHRQCFIMNSPRDSGRDPDEILAAANTRKMSGNLHEGFEGVADAIRQHHLRHVLGRVGDPGREIRIVGRTVGRRRTKNGAD